jgi:thiopurine S-methyltransferase
MDPHFWHQKWKDQDIGFHEKEGNALLAKYFARLPIAKGGRIFLPLCGKTRDIAWLLDRGCRVAGAELSELAIRQLFDELAMEPVISRGGDIHLYQAQAIDIYAGDIFGLTRQRLGAVDADYDRAALIALPAATRMAYAAHMMQITGAAPQLLISCEYDQRRMDGPPFSVAGGEVRQLYGTDYQVSLLESRQVPGGLKGKVAADEIAWLLEKRNTLRIASVQTIWQGGKRLLLYHYACRRALRML